MFTAFAIKRGFKEKEIMDAGLAIESIKNKGRIYDRFRGRIMFPIEDIIGRIIGFGGRIISKQQKPVRQEAKYINTPETRIFSKSKNLYRLSRAGQRPGAANCQAVNLADQRRHPGLIHPGDQCSNADADCLVQRFFESGRGNVCQFLHRLYRRHHYQHYQHYPESIPTRLRTNPKRLGTSKIGLSLEITYLFKSQSFRESIFGRYESSL